MISTFYNYLNTFRPTLEVIRELEKYDCIKYEIKPWASENRVGLGVYTRLDDRLSNNAKKVILYNRENNSNLIELYVTTRIINQGPVVFRPTQLQFSMLEQMKINIPITEYNQPFETIIIELPEQYYKTKIAELPQAGEIYAGSTLPETHEPRIVIINHNKELNTISSIVMFDSGLSIKTAAPFKSDDCVEVAFTRAKSDLEPFTDSLSVSDLEDKINLDCIRSALNYCLLLDEIGVKKLGPQNPKYYDQLLKTKSKRPDLANRSRQELHMHPMIYDLDQSVNLKLYTTVDNPNSLPSDDDRKAISPHHRRGHYRRQHFGPNNSMIKRIRVPPVFVNSHLFLGNKIDARATYNT